MAHVLGRGSTTQHTTAQSLETGQIILHTNYACALFLKSFSQCHIL